MAEFINREADLPKLYHLALKCSVLIQPSADSDSERHKQCYACEKDDCDHEQHSFHLRRRQLVENIKNTLLCCLQYAGKNETLEPPA